MNKTMDTPVTTRFAPSPTGFMHVGSVRTALYAWLFARKHNGRFILRIEDTDKEREVAGSIPHIISSLKWLGIEWDEGVDKGGPYAPYLQSQRLPLYHAYAQKLAAAGYAYPDPYSEVALAALRKQAEDAHRPFLFREHRSATIEPWDGVAPLRFRTPEIKRFTWQDAVRGELSAGEEALDDFILIKSDGYPTYGFAHIVDDIEMRVTHVMRGEEFISSTPKFLSVYEALGVTPPCFATMPVILGPDGKKKLSKRDGAKDLLEYRSEGYLPEAFVNYLALLGWNPGTEQEFFTPEELIEAFELSRIQSSGARFDEVKLRTINQHWMRQLPTDEYIARGAFSVPDTTKLALIVPLLKERADTFSAAAELLHGELSCLFSSPTLEKALLVKKEPEALPGLTKEALEAAQKLIGGLQEGVTAEAVKEALMPLAQQFEERGKGGRGGVLWPVRYALSGLERSPDPFTLIHILGPLESNARLQSALGILK